MKTPRTIHYSQLRYENIPHKRGGRARVWYLEYEYKHVWSGIYKDLRLLFWRVLKWLKIEYRKEFLFGLILLSALVPAPKPVHAEVPVSAPAYLKTIPKLSPVVPVVFSVPDEVQPVAPPPAPVAAPVAAPSAPVYSSYPMGANTYRDYIFNVESGFNPAAVNPGGCIGYGQDCNGWLITGRFDSAACPNWRTDIACQLQYWDWYANTIYGGWASAYAFRTTHPYW